MRLVQIFTFAFISLALPGCVKMTLAWADLRPDGPEAAPPALATSIENWEKNHAPALRDAFQAHVYGYLPDAYELEVLSREILDKEAFDGVARLTEYKLQAQIRFGDEVHKSKPFYMNVAAPIGDETAPIILMQTFCPRWDTIPHPAVYRPEDASGCSGGGIGAGVMTYVFGRYIATPPTKMIVERGYGVATIFPSEFAPDSRQRGLAALSAMSRGMEPGKSRWGAIAAWAWGYSLMVDALESDETVRSSDYITWGHSRYGKSALLAAAFDERIDGVIAHQSGTGGASLNRRKKGESVAAITKSYPHWFAESYAAYAGREEEMPVDQHQLLALIAPRPVLLGNARRDVWSDPNGAFRAAIGADPVYELYGSAGLDQTRLDEWKPQAALSFWIRPGTHGVVKEDWPAFLEFLDAHFD